MVVGGGGDGDCDGDDRGDDDEGGGDVEVWWPRVASGQCERPVPWLTASLTFMARSPPRAAPS